MGLVKLSERVDAIGHTFYRIGWDLLNFLKEWAGLGARSIEVDGISS